MTTILNDSHISFSVRVLLHYKVAAQCYTIYILWHQRYFLIEVLADWFAKMKKLKVAPKSDSLLS